MQVCIHPFIFGSYAEAVVKQQFLFVRWFIMCYYKRKRSDAIVNIEAKPTNNLIFFQKSIYGVVKIGTQGCIRLVSKH